MNNSIAVIYEKGVLRPLQPLNLPEQARLEIQIMPPQEAQLTETEQAYRVLVEAGLIQSPLPLIHATEPLTAEERSLAASAYGQAGALSTLIIAERDEV
ncbi:MAG: antitoxin family protein [Anaerolineales bacterium]|nr:antitoxin family protein [Anaerolineales bacterium]